jgi:hypothetical protein
MEPRPPQFVNPHAEIAMLTQRVKAEGAVDSEVESFKAILAQLDNHTISSDEAVREAQRIVDKRQNYH